MKPEQYIILYFIVKRKIPLQNTYIIFWSTICVLEFPILNIKSHFTATTKIDDMFSSIKITYKMCCLSMVEHKYQ